MNNAFVSQFAENIKFKYTCFDRVIIRGYIRRFFFEGCIVIFLKAMGFSKRTNGVMRIFTDQLNAHIAKQAARDNIPVLWWPSVGGGINGAKLEYVQRHYADKFSGNSNHAFCIITDKEPVQTFASRELTSKKGRRFSRIYKCRKPVKQYYIYFHDRVLGGPCYLKISSYLPFHCEFYFNGHNFIQNQLDRKGVSYRKKENAFVDVSDPRQLQQAAEQINGRMVQQRIDHWMNLFFRFDKGTYSTRSKYLQHEWYLGQGEVCSNVIFKSARFCTSLFQRLLDKFHRIGLPDSIAQIFKRRPARSDSKTFWRLYDNKACIKHWFRNNAIKQYNKCGYFIRTETTINNPKSLGLKKPVLYLRAYLWRGLQCNNRFLDCCADVDSASIDDGEADLFSKPVVDHLDRHVAAPDLRKDRQLALFQELLKPRYAAYGFKTAELVQALKDQFQNTAQMRYELRKLIIRKVVEKKNSHSFYRVTKLGWNFLWVSISSKRHFEIPMISMLFRNPSHKTVTQPSVLEQSYALIKGGLDAITGELAMI